MSYFKIFIWFKLHKKKLSERVRVLKNAVFWDVAPYSNCAAAATCSRQFLTRRFFRHEVGGDNSFET
jgi:hypothetical protein